MYYHSYLKKKKKTPEYKKIYVLIYTKESTHKSETKELGYLEEVAGNITKCMNMGSV